MKRFTAVLLLLAAVLTGCANVTAHALAACDLQGLTTEDVTSACWWETNDGQREEAALTEPQIQDVVALLNALDEKDLKNVSNAVYEETVGLTLELRDGDVWEVRLTDRENRVELCMTSTSYASVVKNKALAELLADPA